MGSVFAGGIVTVIRLYGKHGIIREVTGKRDDSSPQTLKTGGSNKVDYLDRIQQEQAALIKTLQDLIAILVSKGSGYGRGALDRKSPVRWRMC